MTKFIIVKHAGEYWRTHNSADPKKTPQPASKSIHRTGVGLQNGVKSSYDKKEEASQMVETLNELYKSHDYGVCELRVEE